MAFTKISESAKNIISSLPDQPTLAAAQLKAKFDEGVGDVVDYINNTLTEELDDKIPTLNPSVALATDASGNIAASSVSSTELSYLGGVTGPIQSQLNGKGSAGTISANMVLVSDGNGNIVSSSVPSANLRNITYGTADPTGGNEGDIYLKVVQ